MKDEAWRRVIDTNLFGTFACTRRALRPMLKARKGRIVNITSISGMHASPGQANYSAAKAGVIGLTKTIAAEVAGKGISDKRRCPRSHRNGPDVESQRQAGRGHPGAGPRQAHRHARGRRIARVVALLRQGELHHGRRSTRWTAA